MGKAMQNGIDKSMLSKRKHIYRVYVDGDKKIHAVKFPIAYINSHHLYFIPGDKQMLEHISMDRVLDSLEEHMKWNAKNGNPPLSSVTYFMFFSISSTDPDKVREEMEKEYEKFCQKRNIDLAKAAMDIKEKEFLQAKAHYESLLQEAAQ